MNDCSPGNAAAGNFFARGVSPKVAKPIAPPSRAPFSIPLSRNRFARSVFFELWSRVPIAYAANHAIHTATTMPQKAPKILVLISPTTARALLFNTSGHSYFTYSSPYDGIGWVDHQTPTQPHRAGSSPDQNAQPQNHQNAAEARAV